MSHSLRNALAVVAGIVIGAYFPMAWLAIRIGTGSPRSTTATV